MRLTFKDRVTYREIYARCVRITEEDYRTVWHVVKDNHSQELARAKSEPNAWKKALEAIQKRDDAKPAPF